MSNNNIDRRNFLKVLSTGTAAASTGLLYGCGGDPKRQGVSQTGSYLGEVPTDKMTYRTNPHTGDKVSLLGYGCMRWPLRQKADGSGGRDRLRSGECIGGLCDCSWRELL